MALHIKEHILWLEISVDDIILMQAFEREKDLCSVETSAVFSEPTLLTQMKEELAWLTGAYLH